MDQTKVEEIKKESKIKKVISIVLNALFYLFIIALLTFAISNLAGADDKTPKLFGRYYMAVITDSMTGEFEVDDVIVVKSIKEGNKKQLAKIKIGDIVTFRDNNLPDDECQFNSHRVVDIIYTESGEINYFICQGDKVKKVLPALVYTNFEDYSTNEGMRNQCQVVNAKAVVGVYNNTKFVGGGKVLKFLRSGTGFGLCVVLPTAILFLVEAFFLIRNIVAVNNEKTKLAFAGQQEAQQAALEAEREKMKKELLEELQREKEAKENKEPEGKEEEKAE